jgi:mannose-6-phosphate isomerase-like protein (cupin superfamily)
MERGSDKHGPRMDDALEKQVEGLERGSPTGSRTDEFRQEETAEPEEAEPPRAQHSPSHPKPDKSKHDVGAVHTPHAGPIPSREEWEQRLESEGLSPPHWWTNEPGDRYGWHSHSYRKVLFCARGSIVFHTTDGDYELTAGDRLEVEPGTEHAATVGPDGVQCVEAHAAGG